MKYSEQFSQVLKQYMQDNKITQRAFADSLGVSEATVSRYLNGERSPKRNILNRISSVCGMDIVAMSAEDKMHVKLRIERLIKANKAYYTNEEKLALIRIIAS